MTDEKIPHCFDDKQMHEFKPQPDITVFEIAKIFQAMEMIVDQRILEKMPAGLGRHFHEHKKR